MHRHIGYREKLAWRTGERKEANRAFSVYGRIFSLIFLNQLKILIKRFHFWITKFFQYAPLYPERAGCIRLHQIAVHISCIRKNIDVPVLMRNLVHVVAVHTLDVRTVLLD
ncbi:hypothetical protein D3C80_1450640 [compost metagenome]